MIKIAIVVEGGMVQTVYSTDDTEVEIEVIDLDLSDFLTDEEEEEHKEKLKRLDEIETNDEYKMVW